jgi:amino-acid N-acetyltransferase
VVTYRKATMADVKAMHDLINEYAGQGVMLRRPLMLLYESVRDFTVAVEDGRLLGTGALHVMGHDLAEVRSLAVMPGLVGKGIGRGIVETLIAEANALGVARVFALTYQQAFFEKMGFEVVKKESLPQKVWKECVYCDKFDCCDEIAVIRYLAPRESLQPDADLELPLIATPNWVRE